MCDVAKNIDYRNSDDNSKPKALRDPKTGRLLPGAQLPHPPRPEIQLLRNLKHQILNEISPLAIPTWIALFQSKNEKIQLGILKLTVETLFPKELIHKIVGKVFHEHEDGESNKLQGLLAALPQFGEFLRYKAIQDRDKVVDVNPEPDIGSGDRVTNTQK